MLNETHMVSVFWELSGWWGMLIVNINKTNAQDESREWGQELLEKEWSGEIPLRRWYVS